jgi:hypothetical protein
MRSSNSTKMGELSQACADSKAMRINNMIYSIVRRNRIIPIAME